MNCQYVRDNLSAYMDKEVYESFILSIEAHLQACKTCRDYYEGLRRVSRVLDVWEDAEPPVFMKRSIMERVRPKRRVSRMNVLMAAAAALIIAVSVFLIYGGNGPRDAGVKRNSPATIAKAMDIAHERKTAGDSDVNEDEIIANLQMFTEKDFYDSMDTMKELDYLPLVDDHGAQHSDEKTSSLEFITA
jgi:negative regulator of sigma E activity